GEMTFKEIQTRLNEALPKDITVVSVQKPVHKPSEIAFSDYDVRLYCDNPSALKTHMETAFSKEQITVLKKAKQGRHKIDKEIDIKPNVLRFDIATEENAVCLKLRLTAGDQTNINPTLLLSALTDGFDGEIQNTDILKKHILLENGEPFC
ncbi:MAG: DUF2344 domain-containing protein, partial [Candidatus Fimenecus sp.]